MWYIGKRPCCARETFEWPSWMNSRAGVPGKYFICTGNTFIKVCNSHQRSQHLVDHVRVNIYMFAYNYFNNNLLVMDLFEYMDYFNFGRWRSESNEFNTLPFGSPRSCLCQYVDCRQIILLNVRHLNVQNLYFLLFLFIFSGGEIRGRISLKCH